MTSINQLMDDKPKTGKQYRGRIAPTPSGKMHLGHAQTFWIAKERAAMNGSNSILILRVEDLDKQRCKPHFLPDIIEDLNWFGIVWNIGPNSSSNVLNPWSLNSNSVISDNENAIQHIDQYFTTLNLELGPFEQSKRSHLYVQGWFKLYQGGFVYPSPHSRRDVERALSAPNEGDTEIVFPPTLRCPPSEIPQGLTEPGRGTWRFRVPDGQTISFDDVRCGQVSYTAGVDFGDFVVWRSDGVASYELAVVVDDSAMGITEVVRGEDLLVSTARQILLYRALNLSIPAFFHCPLVRDCAGRRLAKRDAKDDSTIALPPPPPPPPSVPKDGTDMGGEGVAGGTVLVGQDVAESEASNTLLVYNNGEQPREGDEEGGEGNDKVTQLSPSRHHHHQHHERDQRLDTGMGPDMPSSSTTSVAGGYVIPPSTTLHALRRAGWSPEAIRRELFQCSGDLPFI